MCAIVLCLRKRTQTKEEFLAAGHSAPWLLTAFSMAATWVWAPSMFTAAEKAYTQGFAGMFWFVVPNILTMILFAFFANKMRKLRISQFFSIDTIKSLPKVLEFYPDLYQRILRREPNADLVMLYHDTDMFRSSKQGNKFDLEKGKDYKQMFIDTMKKAAQNPDDYPGYAFTKKIYARCTEATTVKIYQKMYQVLLAGDPKNRSYRILMGDLYRDVQNRDKKHGRT